MSQLPLERETDAMPIPAKSATSRFGTSKLEGPVVVYVDPPPPGYAPNEH